MIKNIPLFCKFCSKVDLLPTYASLVHFVNRKWDMVFQKMDEATKQKLKIGNTLAINTDLSYNKKLMKKGEHIEFYCRHCIAVGAERWYKSKGYNVIRYGNIVVDINFAEDHRDEVNQIIAMCRK